MSLLLFNFQGPIIFRFPLPQRSAFLLYHFRLALSIPFLSFLRFFSHGIFIPRSIMRTDSVSPPLTLLVSSPRLPTAPLVYHIFRGLSSGGVGRGFDFFQRKIAVMLYRFPCNMLENRYYGKRKLHYIKPGPQKKQKNHSYTRAPDMSMLPP